MGSNPHYDVIVIGGGHAGAEAAWAAANLGAHTALITMDPSKIGAMSCNPAIGGLAKGQIVREVDAMGGLMGLAADATGIQFRVLNSSKGPAVRGPRCQSDKYRYAREVQRLLATHDNLTVLAGTVQRFEVVASKITGVWAKLDADANAPRETADCCGEFGPIDMAEKPVLLCAGAVVLTTGTFMRGLMHTGNTKTPGGRVGEGPAGAISRALAELGFELGRLKTGTPPRLAAGSINFDALQPQPGDDTPLPFSDMTDPAAFPAIEQRLCHITHTTPDAHELIRDNLHRAPMYNGQIDTPGPRYCPSIEDKVVRFANRASHQVYLEPESLDTDELYCNGISTSLPADVQDVLVRHMPGCADARILRYGYAVEYDMVWPHQIDATAMTKRVEGLFLAGQINGTSGYEEAAGQGLIAGLNAARHARGEEPVRLRRDQAYIGVMMDDLVTKTPREPYRMFTSRAEHRLRLRADNADERLTALGRSWGLIDDARWSVFRRRQDCGGSVIVYLESTKHDGRRSIDLARGAQVGVEDLRAWLVSGGLGEAAGDRRLLTRVLADLQYAGYIGRNEKQIARLAGQEGALLPVGMDFERVEGLRNEARQVLNRFRPRTLGQASRLAGITPADVMVLSVAMGV